MTSPSWESRFSELEADVMGAMAAATRSDRDPGAWCRPTVVNLANRPT